MYDIHVEFSSIYFIQEQVYAILLDDHYEGCINHKYTPAALSPS